MKTPYKTQPAPATVIVRRRTSAPAQVPPHATPATTNAKATCGHPLDPGRSKKKRCRACCQVSVLAQEDQGKRNRLLRGQKGRLPHAASFVLIYDAQLVRWQGQLRADIAGVGEVVLTADHDNVFGLMRKLDFQYRKAMPENAHLAIAAAPTAEVIA